MELRRELGLKEVVATVVTSVIGGGLFISTVQIQSKVNVGSAIVLSYIIAAIPAFLMALCYAVLSSALPSSGGEYVFISKIIDPFIGFISTWARWFAMIATIAAMAVGDIILINNFFDIIGMHTITNFITENIQIIAILLVILFFLINYLGVKVYGRVQTTMFVLLMLGISLLVIFGLQNVSLSNLEYSFHFDTESIAMASSLIFFSYIGFAAIANAGDEVKEPEKILPKGITISMFAIATAYIAVAIVTYGSMSPSFYDSYNFSSGSVPELMAHFLPAAIAVYVAFAGSIAIISDINPMMLATSRLSFAWARDKIVPEKMAELNRFGVPKWSLVVNAIVAIIIIVFAKVFMNVVMMINMAVLLIYIAISIATLILPYKHPEIFSKAKYKFAGIWAVALAGMLLSALFFGYILQLEGAMPGFLFLLAWIGIGGVVYVATMESHKLPWRIYKEEKKEKERIDKEIISQLLKKLK